MYRTRGGCGHRTDMNAFQQRKEILCCRYTVFIYRRGWGGKMQVKAEARNLTGNGKWGQEQTLAQQKGGSFNTMRDKRRILIALDTNNVIGLPGQ